MVEKNLMPSQDTVGSEVSGAHKAGATAAVAVLPRACGRGRAGGRRRAGREKEENPRRNSEREGRRAMMAGGVAS